MQTRVNGEGSEPGIVQSVRPLHAGSFFRAHAMTVRATFGSAFAATGVGFWQAPLVIAFFSLKLVAGGVREKQLLAVGLLAEPVQFWVEKWSKVAVQARVEIGVGQLHVCCAGGMNVRA